MLLPSCSILLTLLIALCASKPLEKREPRCTDIVLPITVSANNADLSKLVPAFSPKKDCGLLGQLLGTCKSGSGLPDDGARRRDLIDDILNGVSAGLGQSLGDLLGPASNLVFDQLVSGTYNIAARYCEPEVFVPGRENTLQLLVHGALADRDYWSGLAPPGQSPFGDGYSWVSKASQEGYPTLAIDRLGSGLSDHPDPILIVQYETQLQIHHQIIEAARAGALSFPRAFDRIIYVGHNYGSTTVASHLAQYPEDVDALVLTAYSGTYLLGSAGSAALVAPLPAATVEPARFGNLALGYFESSSFSGFAYDFFYTGHYDLGLEAMAFQKRSTVTVGELATFPVEIQTVKQYKGSVFMVSGEHDMVFCNGLGLLVSLAECGNQTHGPLANTKSLFPSASAFDVYTVPNAGHWWVLHYGASTAFSVVHDWLSSKGSKGVFEALGGDLVLRG